MKPRQYRIVTNSSIYLQEVVWNSKAASVVESFPAAAASYHQAMHQTQERFGKKDLLVQVCIRDLLMIVMKNAVAGRVKTVLAKFYDVKYDIR